MSRASSAEQARARVETRWSRLMSAILGVSLIAVPLLWSSDRPAHANAPVGRYTLKTVGTVPAVFDTQTKLTWMRSDLGWHTYTEALTVCPTGWRLPRMAEAITLIDVVASDLDGSVFSIGGYEIWSSSPSQLASFQYWWINWYVGIQLRTGGASESHGVLCVQ